MLSSRAGNSPNCGERRRTRWAPLKRRSSYPRNATSPAEPATHEVLEAQQQLFPTQLNLARTQRDQLLTVVALYKALGGGWRDETNSAPAAFLSRN